MADNAPDNDVMFISSALGPGELRLERMRGREAISELFSFELWLTGEDESPLAADALQDMLAGAAGIAFGNGHEYPVWGVLRELELMARDDGRAPVYRAVLVPRLWYTTQTFRSRVHQELSVPDIVRAVLADSNMEEGEHFEMALEGSYPTREYVLQYQESDFDFISRLLEYEGICYFFEHTPEGEKVVFTDARSGFSAPAGYEEISYVPRGGVTDPGESIASVSYRTQVVPQQVALRDYNWRTPSVPLLAQQKVDAQGRGLRLLYGEHFKDAGEGKRLAKVRSEELMARRELYTGSGNVRALRSGQIFTLAGHPLGQFDQEYLVTEVMHQVEQAAVSGEGAAASRGTLGYSNTWVAMPAGVPFRPERRTPRPRVHGIVNAVVDGTANGAAAPIDEQGRYKVLLPFDVSGKAGGRASRWIRMVQAASGAGYGLHFPLHVGTEVAISHVNGDPDRPIIVGSVPNPETLTPVVSDNATQSVIRTRAGIHVEFEDDA
jgi:type VI secretion system secreted protein VgrG